ncbi:hypothetical protein BC829DRAFT_31382 [Chytridium lagenaria]|nr:hypothetical protein BC829DRAFT_31382 [Chytridium lagenaria]
MSTNDEQKAAGSHGRSYSAHSESDTSSSELDAMGASLPSRAVRGTMGGRGILRPASFTDDGDGSKKKAVTIDAASSVGHDRSSSVASSVGQSGVMHGGLSTISNSNASSRRASVVSNAQSELGTFLTMGIDLKGDMPTPPPPQVRRASVMMMRAPTDMTRQSVTTAVYTSNDPNRLAKIENAANFVIDDSLLSNMSSMSFEPPPIFGNHELAQVIDMVLAKVAGESNTRASAEDVVAIFHGSFGADVPDHFPKDEEGRKYHSAIVALQIKLKTSNAILNEMGKRMEKLQRWVNEVSSRAAAFEQERTHHVAVVEALRNQIKGA